VKKEIFMSFSEERSNFRKESLKKEHTDWALSLKPQNSNRSKNIYLIDVENIRNAQPINKGSKHIVFDFAQKDLRPILGISQQENFGIPIDTSGRTNYVSPSGLVISGLGIPSDTYVSQRFEVQEFIDLDSAIWSWFIANLSFYKMNLTNSDSNSGNVERITRSFSPSNGTLIPPNFHEVRGPLIELICKIGASHVPSYRETTFYAKSSLANQSNWNLRRRKDLSAEDALKLSQLVSECRVGSPVHPVQGTGLDAIDASWLSSGVVNLQVEVSTDLVQAAKGDVITNVFGTSSSARAVDRNLVVGPGFCVIKPISQIAAGRLLTFLNSHEGNLARYAASSMNSVIPRLTTQEFMNLEVIEVNAFYNDFSEIMSQVISE
jgi:hypothetical protein